MTNAIFQHVGFQRGFIGGFVNIAPLTRFLKSLNVKAVEIVAASHFERQAEADEDVKLCRHDRAVIAWERPGRYSQAR